MLGNEAVVSRTYPCSVEKFVGSSKIKPGLPSMLLLAHFEEVVNEILVLLVAGTWLLV